MSLDDSNNEIENHTSDQNKMLDKKCQLSNLVYLLSLTTVKGIGITNKIKYKITENTFITLYYTFIYPFLLYCNIMLANAAQQHLDKLIILQKNNCTS